MEDVYNHVSRYKKAIKRLAEQKTIKANGKHIKVREENLLLAIKWLKFKEQRMNPLRRKL